jgi:hypothetical protein
MIYLSRMADSATRKYTKSEVKDVKTTSLEAEKIEAAGEDKNKRGNEDESDPANDASSAADMGAKLYCATALCNWARNPANANRLATEGAVRAIIHLALEPIPRICFFCAGAFRFMSDSLTLATTMIDDGAISVISDIIKLGTADDSIIGNLTIALVIPLICEEEYINVICSLINYDQHEVCICPFLSNASAFDTPYVVAISYRKPEDPSFPHLLVTGESDPS